MSTIQDLPVPSQSSQATHRPETQRTQRCSHTQEALHMFQAARELSLLDLTCSALLQRLENLVMLQNLTAL